MGAARTIERASPSPVANRVAPSAGSRMSRVSQPARTTSAGEGRMKPGSPLRAAIRAQTATSTDSKASGGTDLATKVLRGRAEERRDGKRLQERLEFLRGQESATSIVVPPRR